MVMSDISKNLLYLYFIKILTEFKENKKIAKIATLFPVFLAIIKSEESFYFMTTLITLAIGTIILSLIICIHELGHFLAFRKVGIRVIEFSIGFGHKIYGKEIKGTMFSIRAIPFGGYVMPEGDEDDDGKDNSSTVGLASKPWYIRFFVYFAGPLMNFLTVIAICFIFNLLSYETMPIISEVKENGAAYEAGLLPGDEIKRVHYIEIKNYDDILTSLVYNPKEEIPLHFVRDKYKKATLITPQLFEYEGKTYGDPGFQLQKRHIPVIRSAGLAFSSLYYLFEDTLAYYKKWIADIVSGKKSEQDELMGPIGMISEIGKAVNDYSEKQKEESKKISEYLYSMSKFVLIEILWLSFALGFFNIIPIPGLDGGRMLLCLIEGISRRRFSPNIEGYIVLSGLLFVLLLIIYGTYNDIRRMIRPSAETTAIENTNTEKTADTAQPEEKDKENTTKKDEK